MRAGFCPFHVERPCVLAIGVRFVMFLTVSPSISGHPKCARWCSLRPSVNEPHREVQRSALAFGPDRVGGGNIQRWIWTAMPWTATARERGGCS
jgi:hypothetical protein